MKPKEPEGSIDKTSRHISQLFRVYILAYITSYPDKVSLSL